MEGRYEEVHQRPERAVAEQNEPDPAQRQWPVMSLHTCEYILMAPTSPAIPIHDEPVTFLNQNHSYEIRFRTSFPTEGVHHMLKTVITLCFENRKIRIQPQRYLEEWRKRNLGKRFFVLDTPTCPNVSSIKCGLRSLEMVWDGGVQNTSIFVKFFVVSSDFTENAGEKGQPFRLVFQTFSMESGVLLQQSSAQVQIFKLRGAERKRQTEREKAAKLGNQEQFQPAYDYTILLDTSFGYDVEDDVRSDFVDGLENMVMSPDTPLDGPCSSSHACIRNSQECCVGPATGLAERTDQDGPPSLKRVRNDTDTNIESAYSSREASVEMPESNRRLLASSSPTVTGEWLRRNRFQKYIHLFADFNGEDLLRISLSELSSVMKSDSQAIRLYHAMRQKAVEPLCTIYMAVEDDDEYTMISLVDGTMSELRSHISTLAQKNIEKLQVSGPNNIRVAITDEVIQSWPHVSIFRATFVNEKCLLTDDRQSSNASLFSKFST